MINPVGNSSPAQQPADSQSKIERLLTMMETLRKELHELHEKFQATKDLKVRRELRYRMEALEEMLQNLQQQLVMLMQLENTRKNNQRQMAAQALRGEPASQVAAAGDTAANADTTGDDGGADIYYPPGSNAQT